MGAIYTQAERTIKVSEAQSRFIGGITGVDLHLKLTHHFGVTHPRWFILRDLIQEELDLVDEAHMGKNNWDSMFIARLLHQDVLVWLSDRFNQQGRMEDAPLCP